MEMKHYNKNQKISIKRNESKNKVRKFTILPLFVWEFQFKFGKEN